MLIKVAGQKEEGILALGKGLRNIKMFIENYFR